jgi:predicted transport protein
MLNNKADFILEYNENAGGTLQRNSVDWSQSRVIFISPTFTNYQQESINFKDLPIELWEIKRYSNDTVNYSQVQTAKAQETIKTITQKGKTIESVTKEIRVYTEEEHIEKASDEIKELYDTVKNAVLNLGEMEVKSTKLYVALVASSNVVDICIQRNALKLWLNLFAGELDDPKGIARDVSNIGHWGNGDYEIRMENTDNLEYILSLIKQSLRKNGK